MEIKLTNAFFFHRKGILQFIMRTFLFLFCTTVFSFSTDTLFSQNEKITIDVDKTVTIYEVFDLIRAQTEYTFIYQADIFKNIPKVHLKKGAVKVTKLLKENLPVKDFSITTTKDNYIIIRGNNTSKKQQDPIRINGKVTDKSNNTLAGITVRIKGTNRGTSTNADGNYTLTVPNSKAVLIFTSIGFVTTEISVGTQTTIDMVMEEAMTQLNEVTLNAGYYSVKEKERTGNIAKVKQYDIEQQPISNPIAALQGRVSGVEITQTSGVPGAGFDIKIRGQNSIRSNGNDPLYVIDGVPYSSASLGEQQASSIIPGLGISPLNNINPQDIESIEILKDADATAIYGSRGANGVVLITTKKGKYGATKVEFNISSGMGTVSNTLDLLSTAEYLAMRKEAFANDGFEMVPFYAYDVNGTWDEHRQTNWQKVLFGKTSYLTNIQGSISGGNEQTQFLISGNHYKQTSVFPGDHHNNKVSVLSNLSHTSKNNKLSVQLSTNYTANQNSLPGDGILVLEALSLAPNAPELYHEDGSLNWENSTWSNPLSRLEGIYKANATTLISNASISYNIIDKLRLSTNFGYTEDHLKEINTVPSTIYDPAYGWGAESSYAVHNTSQRTSWIVEPQLHWGYNLKHTKIEALAGFSFQEQKESRLSQFAFGFSNNNFIENSSAASYLFPVADTQAQYRYQAIFGRINLNHQGKYLVNFTGRRDGSSRFGPNKRFSNFGAIGAAWIFSKESFIEKAFPFLNYGKIRASYGTSGNDQIGDYEYLDTYSFGSTQYQNAIGLLPTRLFNPDFSWESNKKMEFSLEFGFLRDRIFISSNYYSNRSSNQLVGIPLPDTTGFSSLNANLNAIVENKGWEFELNTVNIRNDNFKWSTSFNLTIPKNKLIAFPNLEGSTYANQLVIGEPLNR